MCFRIDKAFKTRVLAQQVAEKPLIAKTNITVYKDLNAVLYEGTEDITFYYSPHRSTPYRLGEKKVVEKFSFKFTRVSGLWNVDINKGLHSYSTHAIRGLWKGDTESFKKYGRVLIKCRIPKGTPYFKNERGEYVSLKLETPKKYNNLLY